jgi:hypothetical protein
MLKRLFEVKKSIKLTDEVRLYKGERVYLDFYGPNGYPLCHGYDVAFDESEWDEFLEEVE